MISLIEYYRKKEDTDTNSIVFERVKEEDITICGKTLEEVIIILKALDIERETGIKMCMENLNKYVELYHKEQDEIQQKAIYDFMNWRN